MLPLLRLFRREQFLFLRTERVLQMRAEAIVDMIASFAGLATANSSLQIALEHAHRRKPNFHRACTPATRERLDSMHNEFMSPNASVRRAFDGMRGTLGRFFAPFNAVLAAELGPEWAASNPLWGSTY